MHAWHESDGGWVSETKQEVPNSKFEPNRPSHPQSHILHDRGRIFIVCYSGFAPSALSLRLNSWSHAWHDSDRGIAVYLFLSNCLSSELRVGFCQYSRAFFALGAIYFGIFARRAHVRSRTPMILCLSIARSGNLHFGTSFCCATCLGSRDNSKYHTYIHTYMT